MARSGDTTLLCHVAQMIIALSGVAQFLTVCSSSIRAETLGDAVSFSRPWRGKRRVLEWRKTVLMDQW